MKNMTFGLILGLAMAFTSPAPRADAQTTYCAPHGIIVERLGQGYGETRQSIGLGSDNVVLETFASRETGTWTITITTPGGLTCLLASGQAFELLSEATAATGEGT
jgi:hypothetical protein